MAMESNIATSPGSFANEATSLLQEVRKMMHIWMMKEMAKAGAGWTVPEPCPCLVPFITDHATTTQQMEIVRISVGKIQTHVSDVNTDLVAFHTKLTEFADKAKAANYIYQPQVDYCWSCEEIAACRQTLEQALCNLSAEFAALQVAVQGVLRGFYLIAMCQPDPCGEGAAYVGSARGAATPSTASPPSTQTPTAKGKQSA